MSPPVQPPSNATAQSHRLIGLLLGMLLALGAHAQDGSEDSGTGPRVPGAPEIERWEDPDDLARGYLPKEDLGIGELTEALPDADGRGVIVAVLDTGVDLLHAGLQRTTTGLPKIVDYVDMTDAGIVPTTVERDVADGKVRGLTGRDLTLGRNGGEVAQVRLGRIRATEFFPSGLARRLVSDRKTKRERAQQVAADREFGTDLGKASEEDIDELGPIYDVVVFRLGERFACAVDTDEDGDLAEETTLIDYRDSFAVARFPDELNFGMAANLAADGSEVSFLFDGGGHGTHVAGIIGSYYGEGDPLNGLAPGAQILALKVGNGRLGGATTHMSIIKALDYAAKHGARVANASFGGGSYFQNGLEETVRFAEQLIDETGLLCTFSAGNNGPALSTVGSPALGERIFSIGASVSPKTQASNYGVLDPFRTQLFSFSSRGPLYSGGTGVDFLAPGVALSTVPTWFLESADSWNGTSMAAPQAAGALAVLLSAAAQNGIDTEYRKVRAALERSCRELPHLMHVEQGYGQLRVPEASAQLEALSEQPAPILWRVTATNDTGRGAGLYDRAVLEQEPFSREVKVEPVFTTNTTNDQKASFARILRVEDVPAWIRVVRLVHVTSSGADLELELVPGQMQSGLNAAQLRLVDSGSGREATRVSVVMIRPTDLDRNHPTEHLSWSFLPGDRHSTFLRVPEGTARIRVVARETGAPSNDYDVRLSQVSPWSGQSEEGRRLGLALGAAEVLSLAVEAGATVELVAYSRWRANNTAGVLELDISCEALIAEDPDLEIPAGSRGKHWRLFAPLGAVDGRISADLDGQREPIAMKWELARDPWYTEVGKEGTMFVARGSARLRATEAGQQLTLDLRTPDEFDDFLDDSFWRAYDTCGAEVAHGFLHEGRASWKAAARGDFRFEATVVAYGRDFLASGMERLISAELVHEWKGDAPKVYRDIYTGVPGNDPVSRINLGAGERDSLYVRVPDWPAGFVYRGQLHVRSEVGTLLDTRFCFDNRGANDAAALRAAATRVARSDLEQALWQEEHDAASTAAEQLAQLGSPVSDAEQVAITLLSTDTTSQESAMRDLADLIAAETGKDRPDRNRLGLLHGLAATMHERNHDTDAAVASARAALDGKAPRELELVCKLLAERADGKPVEAVKHARELVKLRPYDKNAARMHIEACLTAGFGTEASQAAATWLDRFPGDFEESAALLERTGSW